jgi:hypothetical protein
MGGLWLSDDEVRDATRRKYPAAQGETMLNWSTTDSDDIGDDDLHRTPREVAVLRKDWQAAGPLEWGGMMLRPGMTLARCDKTSEAPSRDGLYALFDHEGHMLYVGRAKTLNKRLRDHYFAVRAGREQPYASFCWITVPEFALPDVEIAHILALEPERNRLHTPAGWGGHAAMVKALQEAWGVGR